MSSVRSMNGINNIEVNEVEFPDGSTITSAKNLVQLDTNNNFTGNNTFNVNLPTSIVNPDVGDINNNTMLNKFSADKLYSGTDENDFITAFTRNGTTGEITLTQADTGTPITSKTITTITDAQITEIGVNTNKVGITTAQASAITANTAKVGITTAQASAITANTAKVGISTAQASAITANTAKVGISTAQASAITANTAKVGISTAQASAITANTAKVGITTAQADEIDNIGGCFDTASINGQTLTLTPVTGTATNITIPLATGDAVLSGGTTGTPQNFTGFNKFSQYAEFVEILLENTTANINTKFNMNSASANQFNQISTYTNTTFGGTTNIFQQLGGIANRIAQGTTPLGNEILQQGTNSEVGTDGIIRLGGSAPFNLNTSQYKLRCSGGMYIDGRYGFRIPRAGLYANNAGLREWRIDHSIGGGVGTGALNFLYSTSSNNGNGSFITRARLNSNGNLQLDSSIQANYNFSDARLKSNNIYLENATESLLKLSVQSYDKAKMSNFNLQEKTDKTIRETGLIAQETYYNAPEFRHLIDCGIDYYDEFDVSGNQTGDGKPEGTEAIPDEMDLSGVGIGEVPDYEGAGWSKTASASIEYQGFIAYLIKSNQELHERILKLENKMGV